MPGLWELPAEYYVVSLLCFLFSWGGGGRLGEDVKGKEKGCYYLVWGGEAVFVAFSLLKYTRQIHIIYSLLSKCIKVIRSYISVL